MRSNVEVQGPGAASLRTVPCNDGLGAWRPISTAPKDGTEILVYTWAGSFYVVTYDDLYSAPWRVRNDEGIAEQAPAFWQPLPKAPNPLNDYAVISMNPTTEPVKEASK